MRGGLGQDRGDLVIGRAQKVDSRAGERVGYGVERGSMHLIRGPGTTEDAAQPRDPRVDEVERFDGLVELSEHAIRLGTQLFEISAHDPLVPSFGALAHGRADDPHECQVGIVRSAVRRVDVGIGFFQHSPSVPSFKHMEYIETSSKTEAERIAGLISVVIPTFDRDLAMLREAIDSVVDQHLGGLKGVSFEVIVVDDGSAVPVRTALDAYGPQVRVARRDNGGTGPARNTGVRLAQGEMLAFLDSDDVWGPQKIARQVEALQGDPNLDAVFGKAEQFHDPTLNEAARRRFPIRDRLIDMWLVSAMLIRRSSFDQVGGFMSERGGTDIDWMLRARALGLRMAMLPDVVYRRRIHTTNVSIVDVANVNHGRLLALKLGLDRRRAAEAGA